MQFITFGNRIATENFNLGFFYKITFTDSTEVECTCIGIGANFVSFQRQEPELLFTLTLENASTVLSIDFLGGGGTDDYEDLNNKPQINSVELIGNKSLSDLGIQAEITAEDPLSSSLVSGLGTAATANTTDFATAAQGALAATAVQPADLNAYQSKIDSSNKLSADLVDDASTTNKFATAAQLSQIETNKNNISKFHKASGTDIYFSETEPTGTITEGSYWISTLATKVYTPTDNLFDETYEHGAIDNSGNLTTLSTRVRCFIDVSPNTEYTFNSNEYIRILYGYNGETPVGAILDNGDNAPHEYTFTTGANVNRIGIALMNSSNSSTATDIIPSDVQNGMLNLGDTALPYVPKGYIWQ